MTAFGFNDTGGGTTVPRFAAKELVAARLGRHRLPRRRRARPVRRALRGARVGRGRRAAGRRAQPAARAARPRATRDRELDDPPITAGLRATLLDRVRPDVVHFHNLHNLGAALIDEAAARGIPAYFTTHNYWLVCPRAYLLARRRLDLRRPRRRRRRCATCVGCARRRRPTSSAWPRSASAFSRGVTAILAVSDAVRRTLIGAGYPAEMIDVVRQAMPPRTPRSGSASAATARRAASASALTVGFLGSAYPHKGPQLLVEAAQLTPARAARARSTARSASASPAPARARSTARGVVELGGAFSPPSCPSCWPASTSPCCRRCGGTARRWPPPSAWPARVPVLGAAPGRPRRGRRATASTACSSTASTPTTWRAQLDRLAGEPGLLERLQARHRGAARVRRLRRRARGRTTPASAPSRVATRAAAPSPSRWRRRPRRCRRACRSSTARSAASLADGTGADRARGATDRTAPPAPLPHAADVEVRHQWPPDLAPARARAAWR